MDNAITTEPISKINYELPLKFNGKKVKSLKVITCYLSHQISDVNEHLRMGYILTHITSIEVGKNIIPAYVLALVE